MALIIKENDVFQVPATPFSTLAASGSIQTQEYEQFLDYLAQAFNNYQENVNSVLDFFDMNKCPEKFLKLIAFNLGMEIPLEEQLTSNARSLIQNAITIYKTKGTFDAQNTSSKGIGLWIKMATGYDINIQQLPLLNPYMFVDQFNYRCAQLREGTGSEALVYTAVHPYEKEEDGTHRIMYMHELPKYATEPNSVHQLFGVGSVWDRVAYMFDYLTGQDLDAPDSPGIKLPTAGTFPNYWKYFAFFYDNKLHLLFGQNSSFEDSPYVSTFDFPLYHESDSAIQQESWITESAPFPEGVTSIVVNQYYQIRPFRNFVYFIATVNSSLTKLCRYNCLTRETEILNPGLTLAANTLTAFTDTKMYFTGVESGKTFLYVYDFFKEEMTQLVQMPDTLSAQLLYSMLAYDTYLFVAAQNNQIFRYDIMYDTWVVFTVGTSAWNDSAYLYSQGRKICIQKFQDGLEAEDTCGLLTVDVLALTSATAGSIVPMDTPEKSFIVAYPGFSNVFSAFVTAGRVVYPSTLIINIESYGEFTTSRSLYAKKMETVKKYIDRYVQAGILTVINDDN